MGKSINCLTKHCQHYGNTSSSSSTDNTDNIIITNAFPLNATPSEHERGTHKVVLQNGDQMTGRVDGVAEDGGGKVCTIISGTNARARAHISDKRNAKLR